jgi:hypothetical protein
MQTRLIHRADQSLRWNSDHRRSRSRVLDTFIISCRACCPVQRGDARLFSAASCGGVVLLALAAAVVVHFFVVFVFFVDVVIVVVVVGVMVIVMVVKPLLPLCAL